MERHLILLLAVIAALLGSAAALLRPGLFQLGQRTPPLLGSGLLWRGGPGVRLERPEAPRLRNGGRDRWSRFQGRGPGSAK